MDTVNCTQKQDSMKAAFKDWIFKDQQRREQRVAEKNESREAVSRAGVEANTAVKDAGRAGKR